MASTKAKRNKTIHTPLQDGQDYLARCRTITQPQTRIEDVWDSILLGDMLDVCPLLPPHSVDLLIADPPYNRAKTYAGTLFQKRDADAYAQYTRRWLCAVQPLLKPDATVYVCCDWESSLVIGNVLGEFFHVRNRITWQREKGRGAKANWKNGMEDVWFATVGNPYTFHLDDVKLRRRVKAPYRVDGQPRDWTEDETGKYRDTCPSNFWDDVTVPFWSMAENTAHPTQKPEKLIAKLLLASSDPNAVVLDPFCGSGTTAVVAKKLGRRFIGVEREAQYCVWAQQRLEDADTNPQIQGYRDGVFWERNSMV